MWTDSLQKTTSSGHFWNCSSQLDPLFNFKTSLHPYILPLMPTFNDGKLIEVLFQSFIFVFTETLKSETIWLNMKQFRETKRAPSLFTPTPTYKNNKA